VLPCRQVVNKQESDKVEQLGVPFVAVNLSVGLSLSMPSIALKIASTPMQYIYCLLVNWHPQVLHHPSCFPTDSHHMIAEALVTDQPFGNMTIVGVRCKMCILRTASSLREVKEVREQQ
jgi:hypothetical protein